MTKVAEPNIEIASVALTDEFTAMADYVRRRDGREAIRRRLADIREGRIIEGRDALAVELNRRADLRRRT
jgi:hypothetical protein